jgi:hypothetical protein
MINFGILIFQTLLACIKIFIALKITGITYQLLIFLLALILLFFIYVLRVNDLFIIIMSFLINPFILSFTVFLNFLPYVSLYFYVFNILKRKNVSSNKARYYLLPIILVGFFPIKAQGLFEYPAKNYFMYLFFSKSTNPVNPSLGPGPFSGFFSTKTFQNILSGSKNFIFNPPDFLLVFLSNLLFVLFLVMIFYSFRFFFSDNINKNKAKPILKGFLIFAFIILFLLVILQDIPKVLNLLINFFDNLQLNIDQFNLWYKILPALIISVVLLLILFLNLRRNSRRKYSNINPYYFLPFYYMASFLVIIMLFLFMFIGKLKLLFKSVLPEYLGLISFLILIAAIAFVMIILIILRKSLKSDLPEETFGEKTMELQLKFYKRDPIVTLESIEDIKEFVIFFYFSALMIMAEKGIKIMDIETPYEYLKRVNKRIYVPHFDFMTEVFYKAKYSNHKIDVDKCEEIRNYSLEIINFLKNLEIIDRINLQQGILQ